MKKLLSLAIVVMMSASAYAENLQKIVLVPTPKLTCQNCENKIKKNIRFVKGTKLIETDIPTNTVTITYDADKAKLEDYVAAFKKIGREVKPAEVKK